MGWFKVKIQILSTTNAACIIYSNVTYLVSYWPPWTAEEGDIVSFLIEVLLMGLALEAKMCPHRPQSLKKVNNDRRFRKKKPLIYLFILYAADFRYPKARLRILSRNYSKMTAYGEYWVRFMA